MSDKCHTKISNEKKHQEFERFYVRQTSDIRGESDIKDFVALPTIKRSLISKSLMLFLKSSQILVGFQKRAVLTTRKR